MNGRVFVGGVEVGEEVTGVQIEITGNVVTPKLVFGGYDAPPDPIECMFSDAPEAEKRRLRTHRRALIAKIAKSYPVVVLEWLEACGETWDPNDLPHVNLTRIERQVNLFWQRKMAETYCAERPVPIPDPPGRWVFRKSDYRSAKHRQATEEWFEAIDKSGTFKIRKTHNGWWQIQGVGSARAKSWIAAGFIVSRVWIRDVVSRLGWEVEMAAFPIGEIKGCTAVNVNGEIEQWSRSGTISFVSAMHWPEPIERSEVEDELRRCLEAIG